MWFVDIYFSTHFQQQQEIDCVFPTPPLSLSIGKTNVAISLLESPHGLKFENVYIFSKTLNQPKYRYLIKLLSSIKGIGVHTFSSNEDVIPPSKAKRNSIFIFDDLLCTKENLNHMKAYFTCGRHFHVDTLLLVQSYSHVCMHNVRDNVNILILFKCNLRHAKHVYHNFNCSDHMTFQQFCEMCSQCWKNKHGFLLIDTTSEVNHGRYRRNFDEFIRLKDTQL